MKSLEEIISKEKFVLYPVTDDKFLPRSAGVRDLRKIRDVVIRCIEGGAKIFQYRAKKLDAVVQIKHAETALQVCKENKVLFFVNDRVDIALLVGADGVHLGQEDIPPPLVKKFFPNLLVGFSTHNVKQVANAMKIKESIDYISFGPVFGTKTKENPYPKTGILNLKRAVSISSKPVVAVGGINVWNVSEVMRSGVKVVAMISFVFENPKEIERRCKQIMRVAEEFPPT